MRGGRRVGGGSSGDGRGARAHLAELRVAQRPEVGVEADGEVDRRLRRQRVVVGAHVAAELGRVGLVREARGDVEDVARPHHRVDQQVVGALLHHVGPLAAGERVVRRRVGGRRRAVHAPALAPRRLHEEDVLLVGVQLRRAREAGLREVDVEPDRELRRVDHREGDVGERRHDEAGVEHHHRRGVHRLVDVVRREALLHRLVEDALAPLHAVRHELRRQQRHVAVDVGHRVRADRERPLLLELERGARPPVLHERGVRHQPRERVAPRRRDERARREARRERERRRRRRRRRRDRRELGGGGGHRGWLERRGECGRRRAAQRRLRDERRKFRAARDERWAGERRQERGEAHCGARSRFL